MYKDVNILANHLHGFYGNPGTENIACDPLPDNTSNCYRGDNIFADIPPGTCNYYQYDVADVASPGALWYALKSCPCTTLCVESNSTVSGCLRAAASACSVSALLHVECCIHAPAMMLGTKTHHHICTAILAFDLVSARMRKQGFLSGSTFFLQCPCSGYDLHIGDAA